MQLKPTQVEEQIELMKDSWIKLPDGKYINKFDEVPKYYSEKEKISAFNKSIDSFIAILGNDIKDLVKKQEVTYETNTRTINKKSKKKEIDKIEFDAIPRIKKEEFRAMDLDFNERAVYRELCSLCYGKDNCVTMSNEIPTLAQLSEEIGLKERTLSKHLISLEEKGLISRKSMFHKKMIFINPRYYTTHLNYQQLSKQVREIFGIPTEE